MTTKDPTTPPPPTVAERIATAPRRKTRERPSSHCCPISTRVTPPQREAFHAFADARRLTRCEALRRIFDAGLAALTEKS